MNSELRTEGRVFEYLTTVTFLSNSQICTCFFLFPQFMHNVQMLCKRNACDILQNLRMFSVVSGGAGEMSVTEKMPSPASTVPCSWVSN